MDTNIDYKCLCELALDMIKDMRGSLWVLEEIVMGFYNELNDENSKLFKQSEDEKR